MQDLAKNILQFRDTPPQSGLIRELNSLSKVPGVTPQILNVIRQETYPGGLTVIDHEMVGAEIVADLQRQAVLAVLYALGGMLVYIAFRFDMDLWCGCRDRSFSRHDYHDRTVFAI